MRSLYIQEVGPDSAIVTSAKLVRRINPDTKNILSEWTSEDLGLEYSN